MKETYQRMTSSLVILLLLMTIMTAMTTSVSASAIFMSKTAIPNPSATYSVGDTINYEIVVTNPTGAPFNENNYSITVNIYDDYPNGTTELLQSGLFLGAGQDKTFYRSYIVMGSDIDANGRVVNDANVVGQDQTGGSVSAAAQKSSIIVGSIGDFVWNDSNGDGIQDGGESGIPGVTVNLYNDTGGLIATNTTNTTGNYVFYDLLMGDYHVGFIPLSGYFFSPQDQGGDDTKDSDAKTTTGNTSVVNLAAGENNLTLDAGLIEMVPSIDIEKATNGFDADTPTGPSIPVNDSVNWTYVVNNTGNSVITGIVVTDNKSVTVSCPTASLAPGASMTCNASGTAVAGQYANIGNVTGNSSGIPVTDEDPSHYFGTDPAITIEKATNGEDADTPTGPSIPVNDSVNWTYVVNNTGNSLITGIVVTDNKSVTVSCPATSLAPGASMTCNASGTAEEGQYANIGNVTGNSSGIPVTDEDPSHYFGTDPAIPSIDIEKATNGYDADTPTGPHIPVGNFVNWTYVVNNTGNSVITDIVVTDNKSVTVSCPTTSLAPGASMTCTANGTAVAGQYANIGNVTGNSSGIPVTDEDPSHYYGDTTDDGCTYTQGYWKNHQENWPVDKLTLGNAQYNQTELIGLLKTPVKGDASIILVHQLIAAKLNIENGASDSTVYGAISDADNWLMNNGGGEKLPYGIGTDTAAGAEAVGIAEILDDYNNGVIGPGHCEDEGGENEDKDNKKDKKK